MGVNINHQQTLLEMAEHYLRESVIPLASEIDSDPEVLRTALKGMGNRSLLALRVPQVWGGREVSEATYCRFQELVPRYSGALAFLQTQHQSAGGMLANSENEPLKQEYLPRMGQGKVLVGVGFSQLRRPGTPLVKAIPVEGGYEITGVIPWVTGLGLFDDFIIGAILPDGREIYGIVIFREIIQETGGAIAFSQPMELAAMASTNTVSATLTNWFLPTSKVVCIRKAGAIHEHDQKNVLHHGFSALGSARAGLDIVAATAKNKQLNFISNVYELLNTELTNCESAMMQALPPNPQCYEEQLQLRAWAINLAGRCANAAIIVSSGAANSKSHPAQRVYQEAVVFSVSGQTTAVMAASLTRLIQRG